MANLPETSNWDTGVYQLETTDPVLGGATGASNKPQLNLTNRTRWLKDYCDQIASQLANFAPINSPTFTGNPQTPTPPLGDNDYSIPTTAWVQATIGGMLYKNVSGNTNVTLTAIEAGHGILVFSGTLTGPVSVIVPTSPTRTWIVVNATTGSYALQVRTAAGTGVNITQNFNAIVMLNGTNVVFADNQLYQMIADALVNLAPINSPTFTGNPQAPTPPLGDNDYSIPTTEWVQATIGKVLNKNVTGNVDVTLSAIEAGHGIIWLVGTLTGNVAVIFPTTPTRTWIVVNATAGAYSLTAKTASGTGVSLPLNLRSFLMTEGTNVTLADDQLFNASLLGVPTAATASLGTSTTQVATTAFVQNAFNAVSALPVGSLVTTLGYSAPAGTIKLNGAAISRSSYAALFAVLGTSYGAGDGSTTFNIPDARGYFPRFLDDGKGIDPGRANGSIQSDSYGSHNHTLVDAGHSHSVYDPGHAHGVADPGHSHGGVGFPEVPSDGGYMVPSAQSGLHRDYGGQTAGSGTGIGIYGSGTGIGIYGSGTGAYIGGSGGSETRPKNISMLACIKY